MKNLKTYDDYLKEGLLDNMWDSAMGGIENDIYDDAEGIEYGTPFAGEPGATKIQLSKDEFDIIKDNPEIKRLINKDKVSLIDNAVWYYRNDAKTKMVLRELGIL
jgi:hypothetical protein